MSKLSRLVSCLSLLFVIFPRDARSTTQIFIPASDGVWIGSDTLWTKTIGKKVLRKTACKLRVNSGRVIFNAGSYVNLELLLDEEDLVPRGNVSDTFDIFSPLMFKHFWSEGATSKVKNMSDLHVGIVQVDKGVFTGATGSLTNDGKTSEFVDTRMDLLGIPYGFGDAINRERKRLESDSNRRTRVLSDPKAELLRLLEEEAVLHPDETGAPYTLLLLHKDGSISDYSETKICIL